MCVKTGLVLLCESSVIFEEPLADGYRPHVSTVVLVAVCMAIMRQSFCGTTVHSKFLGHLQSWPVT